MDCMGLPQGREGLPQEEGARFMEGEVSPRLRVQSCITLIPLFGTEGSLSAWTEYSDKFGKIILSDSSLATLMLHITGKCYQCITMGPNIFLAF